MSNSTICKLYEKLQHEPFCSMLQMLVRRTFATSFDMSGLSTSYSACTATLGCPPLTSQLMVKSRSTQRQTFAPRAAGCYRVTTLPWWSVNTGHEFPDGFKPAMSSDSNHAECVRILLFGQC